MGSGNKISICDDEWVSRNANFRLSTHVFNLKNLMVSVLIDVNERIWKQKLINNTFSQTDVANILRILLAEEAHDDLLV